MRIIKGNDFALTSPTFVGTDRETPTAATGTPTCGVTREIGTALTTATVTADATLTGVYSAALTAAIHTTQVDRLTCAWAATVSAKTVAHTEYVDVVGGHYVTIPELRALDGLASSARCTVAVLEAARDWFEDLVEHHCGVAYVRRYQRDQLDGTGTTALSLTRIHPRAVLSVSVSGTAQTAADFDLYDHGEIYWPNSTFSEPSTSSGARNVVVTYEHGYDSPPADLKDIALEVIRWRVLSRLNNRPSNFISETTLDGTTMRMSTPDPKAGRPTGILALDPWIVAHSERVPGIA